MNHQPHLVAEFNPKILGHNIKEGRKRLGNMPQKELADLVGISRHTLIDLESGKRDAPLSKLVKIAKYLELSPAQLLGINEHTQLNQQESHGSNPKDEATPSEREMFQMRIEGLREHILALEKTCADLREDKIALREELNRLRPKRLPMRQSA
jgi:DNA-binding XRE family transcriptional regulator